MTTTKVSLTWNDTDDILHGAEVSFDLNSVAKVAFNKIANTTEVTLKPDSEYVLNAGGHFPPIGAKGPTTALPVFGKLQDVKKQLGMK